MKKRIFAGAVVIAAMLAGTYGISVLGAGGTCYYVQVDNSRLSAQEPDGGVIDFTGGMEYKYTLPAFGQGGGGREIAFGTSRELKEGAFLRLTAVPVRGVTEWEEVQYGELPEAVQAKFAPPEEDETE